jgi:hypothetical protein
MALTASGRLHSAPRNTEGKTATFAVEEVFNPVTGETVKQLKATLTVDKVVGGERMPVTALRGGRLR